jgi:S-formylglutathione hydrolase FrmB
MAEFTGTFFSEKLSRNVPFTAVIPTSAELRGKGKNKKDNQPKRTIYLLHGWNDSHQDWLTKGLIVELAYTYNVAFILPAGENSFYVDHPNGNLYGEFIGEELVEKSRELFSLSTKRKDTWLAGLSMGGYGALRNGFKYSETFGKVAAFSSRILSKKDAPKKEKLKDNAINLRLKAILESDTLADLKTENDPYELVVKRKEKQDLFIACGLDDSLLKENKAFHKYLKKKKIPHEYFESPGGHDWTFWNEYIEKAVQWLTENN